MGDYVVVAAKIPRKLKDLMDELEIKPGPVIRKALEEEVRRRTLKKLEERARKLLEKLPEISDEEIARLIREDRER
jgi:polyhydroxyalkanoate synthesis regulator phasin